MRSLILSLAIVLLFVSSPVYGWSRWVAPVQRSRYNYNTGFTGYNPSSTYNNNFYSPSQSSSVSDPNLGLAQSQSIQQAQDQQGLLTAQQIALARQITVGKQQLVAQMQAQTEQQQVQSTLLAAEAENLQVHGAKLVAAQKYNAAADEYGRQAMEAMKQAQMLSEAQQEAAKYTQAAQADAGLQSSANSLAAISSMANFDESDESAQVDDAYLDEAFLDEAELDDALYVPEEENKETPHSNAAEVDEADVDDASESPLAEVDDASDSSDSSLAEVDAAGSSPTSSRSVPVAGPHSFAKPYSGVSADNYAKGSVVASFDSFNVDADATVDEHVKRPYKAIAPHTHVNAARANSAEINVNGQEASNEHHHSHTLKYALIGGFSALGGLILFFGLYFLRKHLSARKEKSELESARRAAQGALPLPYGHALRVL